VDAGVDHLGNRNPTPTARRNHSATFVPAVASGRESGTLWLHGGAGPHRQTDAETVFDDLFLYDLGTEQWHLANELLSGERLPARSAHSATLVGSKVRDTRALPPP
jgi:hypothetical protein